MPPLRWTTKSLRNLAEELTGQGHRVSAVTVGRLLTQSGFSLQSHSKTLEGSQHPDRDAQFRYINEQVKQHQDSGEPVISVDTKKKEMLGQLPNTGREWRPKGDPIKVEDHSFFTGPKGETAIPYGIYDLTADTGWVNVGTDHDTSMFAVTSIRRWWQARGCLDYPQATRLLITADAGGSNSHRYRVWKAELADLATETGLSITVSHFPPGTSKWNKIEHRLFSHITMNWRARPLTSHEVVVKAIASTRTRTGLRVHAELDTSTYPLGVAITRAQLEALPIERHETHGTWNYTIHPGDPSAHDAPASADRTRDAAREAALELLAEPVLTGMTRDELNTLAARLAPEQAAQRERRNHQLRGGRRRQAAGDHGRSLLCGKDHVLLTVLYLRQICSQNVMADLLGVTQSAIGPAIAETRELLEAHHHRVAPTTLRFSRRQEVEDYVRTGAVASGRPFLPVVLCDPALTGMSRDDLDNLVNRLSVRQAALVERRRYKQRGGSVSPAPAEVSSGRRSPMANASWPPFSTSAESAPGTSWPTSSR